MCEIQGFGMNLMQTTDESRIADERFRERYSKLLSLSQVAQI